MSDLRRRWHSREAPAHRIVLLPLAQIPHPPAGMAVGPRGVTDDHHRRGLVLSQGQVRFLEERGIMNRNLPRPNLHGAGVAQARPLPEWLAEVYGTLVRTEGPVSAVDAHTREAFPEAVEFATNAGS